MQRGQRKCSTVGTTAVQGGFWPC